jgi:DNA-binding GntR family transcriptional regulator
VSILSHLSYKIKNLKFFAIVIQPAQDGAQLLSFPVEGQRGGQTGLELEKIERQRAVDAVYEAIRQGILTSLFKAGERLNVEDLSKKLGVSLTPVRHAIQQLATEGLVEIRPRSGTFVATLSPRDIEETFDIRIALECLAAEKAVHHVAPKDAKRLKELLKALARAPRTEEERKAHEQDNHELHWTIIRLSQNKRLAELYESLNAHLKIVRIHRSEASWLSRLDDEKAEHEEIVSALVAQDPVRLADALRKHIQRGRDALIGSLGS